MKAISILQPYASLIAIGAKKIETRSWATKYRGPLAIHASAKMGRVQKELCQREPFKGHLHQICDTWRGLTCGHVIATCNLVDCLEIDEYGLYRLVHSGPEFDALKRVAPLPDDPELLFGDYSEGRYAWILEDVQMIVPVPAKGRLGLWEWEGDATR